MSDIFDRVDSNDLQEIAGMVCPYCAMKIGFDFRISINGSDPGKLYHTIPKTIHNFDCLAGGIWEEQIRRKEAKDG